PMIELVFEIRRRVNAHTKPGIKLANPDLLGELGDIYHSSKDTILRTLIKELLTRAGGNWEKLLTDSSTPTPKTVVKVYRGQASVEATSKGSGTPPSKSVRYYRGVRIA
ncbi:MAG: hypothetical protein WDZ30_05155, partial [Cellvibrionaceae bacterium]